METIKAKLKELEERVKKYDDLSVEYVNLVLHYNSMAYKFFELQKRTSLKNIAVFVAQIITSLLPILMAPGLLFSDGIFTFSYICYFILSNFKLFPSIIKGINEKAEKRLCDLVDRLCKTSEEISAIAKELEEKDNQIEMLKTDIVNEIVELIINNDLTLQDYFELYEVSCLPIEEKVENTGFIPNHPLSQIPEDMTVVTMKKRRP